MDSLFVAAALLGVTHAAEPDHVAGVAALAADAGRRRAALVGACFAAGHVALVLVWVLVGSVVLSELPAAGALERAGGFVLAGTLFVVAALTATSGLRTLRGDGSHGHGHVHGRLGLAAADGGTAGVREYLALGAVGALFTLSPPLSMLALVTGVLPTTTASGVLPAVVAYALGIGVVMTVLGGAAGTAFEMLDGHETRLHAAAQFATAGVVATLGLFALLGVV